MLLTWPVRVPGSLGSWSVCCAALCWFSFVGCLLCIREERNKEEESETDEEE